MKCQKEWTLRLHCLYNYWFCYENGKKSYPQIYLEECKYKIKKTKMTDFIMVELESESESESDTELKLKSELESDTE